MLKFATFTSQVELPFWASLASEKIDQHKLDETERSISGVYEIRQDVSPEASCVLQLHGNGMASDIVSSRYYRAQGRIRNVNTIEQYRNLDKTILLTQAGEAIWNAIRDGTVLENPSLLASFLILSFADLKKYKFTFLFAFPAIHSEPSWRFVSHGRHDSSRPDEGSSTGNFERLQGPESVTLADAVRTWQLHVDSNHRGFFLARRYNVTTQQRTENVSCSETSSSVGWEIAPLYKYEQAFFKDTAEHDRFVAFADPSTYPHYPGWMLRNLLVLVRQRWNLRKVQIICYRGVQQGEDKARSLLATLETLGQQIAERSPQLFKMPRVTGWERMAEGKVASRVVNLAEYMDPRRLAEQAVDLNLKLIHWRIAPNLDLDIIKSTKCLLLGAGTLGSYVSRVLMGWGVRKITFVDNGRVSFSNPVRQPLFKHIDCLSGGTDKAQQAAEALREVYPGVDAQGFVFSVPMAGHPILDEAKEKADFEKLKELINQHDAIFLLMDSRESRWLPTVISKAGDKIVMNAALGFDSFVVMRHGMRNPKGPEQDFGCYFCNDVVAPSNSLSDRTLDQQCTVTRPGIAAIASALLVEVFVSVLQHPDRARAPASASSSGLDNDTSHPLGIVPHQIRGYLSSFSNLIIHGKGYDKCSACSEDILEAYRNDGWNFVQRAIDEKGFVEAVSGLAEVQKRAEAAILDIEAVEDTESGDEDAEIL